MASSEVVLLVGAHPFCSTGVGNMMRAVAEKIDNSQRKVIVYGVGSNPDPSLFFDQSFPFSIIHSPARDFREQGLSQHLEQVISALDVTTVVLVGVDCWSLVDTYKMLEELRQKKLFTIVSIFPYDLPTIRNDWVLLFNFFDIPCVYSEFGYELLSPFVPNLRYFRPALADSNLFVPKTEDEIKKIRRDMNILEDTFLFGFVGQNQFRKDPQRFLTAFSLVKNKINSAIYLHMDFEGVFNIDDLSVELKFARGELYAKKQNMRYTRQQMVNVYNVIDCLVNCSWQEGLSYTVLEAMLCGTPVVGTATTAQTELLQDVGIMVPCREEAYLPLIGSRGPFMYPSKAPIVENIAYSMLKMAQDDDLRKELGSKSREKALQWINGVTDINALLDDAREMAVKKRRESKEVLPPKQAILFAQHSSAGDVMMSTQCLKGLKERHPNMPLVYMTQKQFQDIVTNNPYIDEIVDWDETAFKKYLVKYNPHGERILPGGFNSLDAKLWELYPHFTKVKADNMFIDQQAPSSEIRDAILSASSPVCVVHSTGGQAQYRTYTHFDIALKNQSLFIIQIGGADDYVVRCADLNLCGKLSWRETAWVIAHANVVVAVDSCPAHIAGALGINLVMLFGPAPFRVTQAKIQYGGSMIGLEPDKLDCCPSLTNCWGRVGCSSPCISTISPMLVRKAVKFLLSHPKDENIIHIFGNNSQGKLISE